MDKRQADARAFMKTTEWDRLYRQCRPQGLLSGIPDQRFLPALMVYCGRTMRAAEGRYG